MAELEIKNITVNFGGLTALSDLSFSLGSREIVGLISPNGAGKTTVFNGLTGVYRASRGNVTFNGTSRLGKRPHQIFCEINKKEGTTILLVAKNANPALQSTERGYVLETGAIIMEDQAESLLNNSEIRKAYLGE